MTYRDIIRKTNLFCYLECAQSKMAGRCIKSLSGAENEEMERNGNKEWAFVIE
jgi:hypothetical protein